MNGSFSGPWQRQACWWRHHFPTILSPDRRNRRHCLRSGWLHAWPNRLRPTVTGLFHFGTALVYFIVTQPSGCTAGRVKPPPSRPPLPPDFHFGFAPRRRQKRRCHPQRHFCRGACPAPDTASIFRPARTEERDTHVRHPPLNQLHNSTASHRTGSEYSCVAPLPNALELYAIFLKLFHQSIPLIITDARNNFLNGPIIRSTYLGIPVDI
jgi:hypothetical protein